MDVPLWVSMTSTAGSRCSNSECNRKGIWENTGNKFLYKAFFADREIKVLMEDSTEDVMSYKPSLLKLSDAPRLAKLPIVCQSTSPGIFLYFSKLSM